MMRLILFLVGGVFLANIVTATFFWHPPEQAPGKREPVANSATRQGQDRWMANERYLADSRANIRKGMLETLSKPWAAYCTLDGHAGLIGAIDNYYYQRQAEAWSKANSYGEEGKRFAIKAWTTTDDNRIERLTSELGDRGYFALDELKPYARTPLSALSSRGSRASPCAS
jgi:hypothetical protein